MPSVWLITGASRGLGNEFARQLLASGEHVIATARDIRALKDLAAIPKGTLDCFELDVASDESIHSLSNALADRPIDVLINNAGISSWGSRWGGLKREDLNHIFNTNVVSPALVTQALSPQLSKSSAPKIINITSLMGSIEDNGSGGSIGYRISKAGLNMLTKCLSRDLALRSATCLAIHPGWVRTDMGGEHAPLSPAESVDGMLRVIRALTASDNGRFVDFRGNPLPW